jgi:hypothetical protein
VEYLLLIAKWVLGAIGAMVVALVTWNFQRTNDTYTKSETRELIDMKIMPLRDSLEAHKNATERLITVTEKLSDNIQNLNTKIAVIETKVDKS